MILIGQYDSPFVRRVGIALTLYAMTFEHRPWSVFGDADRLQAVNPLMRVPTLVLDDGDILTDSATIIDYLDRVAPKDKVLFPRHEPARHRALKVAALACGLADKAVSLFYERRLHATVSPVWQARCLRQIAATVAALEADRAAQPAPWWFGQKPGHADIAVACALRFACAALPGDLALAATPHLQAHCDLMEASAAFQSIYQPFVAPA